MKTKIWSWAKAWAKPRKPAGERKVKFATECRRHIVLPGSATITTSGGTVTLNNRTDDALYITVEREFKRKEKA